MMADSNPGGRNPNVGRSKSFAANGAKGKVSGNASRSTHKVNTSKGTSAAQHAPSSTYRAPAARPSQDRHLIDVQARQQRDAMLLDLEVVFLQKDITEIKTDVIVCPVSPTLITTAGVSSAVRKKAGPGLRSAFVKKLREGTLPIGHAFVTGSFSLSNCRCIIHVVAPKMPENENPTGCFTDLGIAFDNCFKKLLDVSHRFPGGNGKVETLAIPAIGAGTNKIPKNTVAKVMCEAVHKFLGRRKYLAPHLKKVFLVSLDAEMMHLLRKEWDMVIGPTRSRDALAGKSDDKGSGKSGAMWYDSSTSDSKGDRGRDESDYRTELVSRGVVSPSSPGSTWYDFTESTDKGGRPLVARGCSSGDRDDKTYPLKSAMNRSKERDFPRSTNGGTSYDTDRDSDGKQGACGGAYGSKSPRSYLPSGQIGQSRERDSFRVAADGASGMTDSDSDSGNDAYKSAYGSPCGIGHSFPSSQSYYRGMADAKTMARNYATSPRSGQGRRSRSADAFSDENDEETTLDRTKALAIRDIESCPICFDPIVERSSESLPMCGHKVCRDCWKQLKLHNPVCPVCRKVYGELRGNQPEKARMMVKTDQRVHLPGYERFGTIVIDYAVPDGKQTEEHPNPGKPYMGTYRTAFLPNNAEGNEVLKLLERAFKARLIFTIGRSVTTGTEDVVTWNDIHHKTVISGPEFGYPDPTYLSRVKEELAAKGIK